MINEIITELCASYHLGMTQSDLIPVTGGLLHRIWRLTTERGVFAVKELQPRFTATEKDRKHIIMCEEIALQMRQHGVPAIFALQSQQGFVTKIDDKYFMVFNWQTGITLEPVAIKLQHAHAIGVVLANIHQAAVQLAGLKLTRRIAFSAAHWRTLIQQAEQQGLSWCSEIKQAIPVLVEWNKLARHAAIKLNKHLIVSHRDLDAKNVIWQNDLNCCIIDWEYAGLINPGVDLLGVALNWSGQIEGNADKEKFLAVIAGFRSVSALPEVDQIAVDDYLGYCLEWLELNLRRSIEEMENRALACNEVRKTLAALYSIDMNQDKILAWMQ